MIDEPLASQWRYDLGSRKIYEFRAALGLEPDGPAPRGAVFAYAVVPALARMLTHPQVAAHRDAVRMSRLELAFASEVDMRGELICSIDVAIRDSVVATISCTDGRGAQVVATLHLDDYMGSSTEPPTTGGDPIAELKLDRARCITFAAATWDLNPVYWDLEFSEVAGLGGLVAPPGLSVSLAIEAIEKWAARSLAALDVRFERAARPGDELGLKTSGDPTAPTIEAMSPRGRVFVGRAMLGSSVTS